MDTGDERGMPKWRKAPEELVRRFEEAVKPLPGVDVRKMFGFPAAFYNGQMFASLHQESTIVRLPPEERAQLLAVPGAVTFEPMPGRPMREYVVVPESIAEEPAELAGWLDKSLAYVAALPPKPPKAAKKAKPAK